MSDAAAGVLAIGQIMDYKVFAALGCCPICGELNSRFCPDLLWEFACGHCYLSHGYKIGIERVQDWAGRQKYVEVYGRDPAES